MRLSYVDNESGFSLTELIIALGLTGLLLILVVSGSLFVKKYIADWSDRDKVTEELAFVIQEIRPKIEVSQFIEVFPDSLVCGTSNGDTDTYTVADGALLKNGRALTRAGLQLDLFEIGTYPLPNDSIIDTLVAENKHAGLYTITVAISDHRGSADTLTTIGRNQYESLKYDQE